MSVQYIYFYGEETDVEKSLFFILLQHKRGISAVSKKKRFYHVFWRRQILSWDVAIWDDLKKKYLTQATFQNIILD
jgi:hypothetical protein